MTPAPMNFKQFLLMNCDHPELGRFAIQATSDRNWIGMSATSLRNHLKAINASPERLRAMKAAENAWEKFRATV